MDQFGVEFLGILRHDLMDVKKTGNKNIGLNQLLKIPDY